MIVEVSALMEWIKQFINAATNLRLNQNGQIILIMSSPSKLFSCVDSNTIFKSPLNKSSAKSQFSFSKDDRFKLPKPYCDSFYNLPDNKSMRKTSFGFGRKTDLDYGKHPHNKSPSPDRYQIDTFVDTNKNHHRGSSCHIGRDQTTPRGHIELDPLKVPGPGRYQQFRYNESPKWTMRPVTKQDLFQKTTIRINPGPGAHQFNQVLNPEGKYYCTKYQSSGSKVWNPKSSERFYKSTTDAPGSGNYLPQHNDLSDSGKYVLSKYRGDGKRRFAHGFRDSFVELPSKQTKTPGPGQYRVPSDFGHYDDIYHRMGKSFTKQAH